MMVFRIISITLVLMGILCAVITMFLSRKNNNKPKKKKDGHDFCFLVPARYESKVIEDLLVSIKNQTIKINMKDVYVIIESMEDEIMMHTLYLMRIMF